MKTTSIKKSKKSYNFSVGRRKSSSARIRLFKGTGESLINGQKVLDVYSNKINQIKLNKPFEVTDTLNKLYFTAKVSGGGKEGQLDAIVHGIARALIKLDSDKYRTPLKTSNLLTRDSRVRLRRMVGMGGKSRRKKQSPKR